MITIEHVKDGDFRMGEDVYVNLDFQSRKLWMSRRAAFSFNDEYSSWKVMCPADATRINALLDRVGALARIAADGCELRTVVTPRSKRLMADFTDEALDALIAISDMTEGDVPGLELCDR